MTRTLVLGTDLSTRSDHAVWRAMLLARQCEYDLHVLHVIARAGSTDNRSTESLRSIKHSTAELNDVANLVRSTFKDAKVSCETEVREGEPGEQIRIAAEEKQADLILIGAHQASAIADPFRRFTAERICRTSAVPLLVANALPEGHYNRVLVATDMRDESRSTFAAALALPFLQQPQLVFFHAFDPVAREMLSRTMELTSEREAYIAEEKAQAEAHLRTFANSTIDAVDRVLVRQSSGHAARDILDAAHDAEVDLILIHAGKHGLFYETVVGSVVRSVLKTTDHDVLIV